MEIVYGTFDWRGFYANFLDPEFGHYKDFFSFKVQHSPHSQAGAKLLYKGWSTTLQWLPDDPRGVQVSQTDLLCMSQRLADSEAVTSCHS